MLELQNRPEPHKNDRNPPFYMPMVLQTKVVGAVWLIFSMRPRAETFERNNLQSRNNECGSRHDWKDHL